MTGEPRSGNIGEEMTVEDGDTVTVSGPKAIFGDSGWENNIFPVILYNRAQFRYKLCHQAYLVEQFLGSEERGKQGTEFKGPPAVMVGKGSKKKMVKRVALHLLASSLVQKKRRVSAGLLKLRKCLIMVYYQ